MAIQSSKIILRSCVIAAMSGVFSVAMVYPSLSQSPHATVMKFGGSWNGGGTITPLSGGNERVNCKVTFDVKASTFAQDINCSGPTKKFDIDSSLNTQGNNIEGKWSDKVSGYSGGASGTVGTDKIDLRIEGPGFNGKMDIAISGGSQTVRVTQYDVKTKGYKTVADIKLRK